MRMSLALARSRALAARSSSSEANIARPYRVAAALSRSMVRIALGLMSWTSRLMSTALMLWVRSPTEITSTPVSAIGTMVFSLMPPEASVIARLSTSFRSEADVDRPDAVGEVADRDHVHSRLGDRHDGLLVDAARGFGDRPLVDELPI